MIKLYGATWCGYCREAERVLLEHGLSFEKVDIEQAPEERTKLKEMGLKTIPQIWIDEKHVGGYTELVSHLTGGDHGTD